MLVAIDETNMGAALDLLEQGFPARSREFFTTGIARMAALGDNAGLPVGQLLVVKDKACGVVLTLGSRCRAGTPHDEPERTVNFSSWYIAPDQRWRAPFMLSKLVADKSALYTDLTPTEPVRAMLEALGFEKLNDGQSVVVAPLAGIAKRAAAEVLDPGREGRIWTDKQTLDMLDAHRPFGCEPLIIRDERGDTSTMFKRCSLRGLPAARLIYCTDNAAFQRNLGAVARYLLLKRFYALIVFDTRSETDVGGITFANRGLRYARGPALAVDRKFDNRTDFSGSELALFDF